MIGDCEFFLALSMAEKMDVLGESGKKIVVAEEKDVVLLRTSPGWGSWEKTGHSKPPPLPPKNATLTGSRVSVQTRLKTFPH